MPCAGGSGIHPCVPLRVAPGPQQLCLQQSWAGRAQGCCAQSRWEPQLWGPKRMVLPAQMARDLWHGEPHRSNHGMLHVASVTGVSQVTRSVSLAACMVQRPFQEHILQV